MNPNSECISCSLSKRSEASDIRGGGVIFKMNDCFIFSRRSLTRTANQSDGLASSSSWEPITKKRRWHSEHVQISIGISSQFCSKSEAPISINSISFECLISVHWQYGQHIGSGLYIFFTFSPISFSRH